MTHSPDPKEHSQQSGKSAANWVTRQLVKWVPTGLSGSLLIHSVLGKDWFSSALSVPFTILTLAWISYSDGFLDGLSAVSRTWGEEDAKRLQPLKAQIEATIRWQLAKTDDKYRRCQANDCSTLKTEGFAGVVHQLDQIFVPLALSGDVLVKAGFNPFQRQEKELRKIEEEGVEIWRLVRRAKTDRDVRRLVIQAWGGYGKTTLMRHIAYTLSQKRHRQHRVDPLLPVLIYLRDLQTNPVFKQRLTENTLSELTLPELIETIHLKGLPQGKQLKLPPCWAENHLNRGRMLVMFDGFDEVPQQWRLTLSTWIGQQMAEYPESMFIVTSRPTAFTEDFAREYRPVPLFVKAFNRQQQKDFLERWYFIKEYRLLDEKLPESKPKAITEAERKTRDLLQQLGTREELGALAKNPLLLNMIASLHQFGSYLPQRRVDLYQDICTLQLKFRPQARGIPMLLPDQQSQQILQGVALAMLLQQEEPRIAYGELVKLMAQQIQAADCDDLVDVLPFVKQMRDVSELIVKHDEEYEFSHWSLQAFLAAKQLVGIQEEGLKLIESRVNSSAWAETIILYSALTKPTALLQMLCKLRTQNAISLAYKCVRECPRKIDQELLDEINNLRYEALETHLKEGQFKQADRKTYRLMLETVGREDGDYLRLEEIETFPCEDLRRLDQLWVDYSEGKYGFSVQKQIWLDCGGIPRDLIDDDYNCEIYKKFARKVKWLMDDNWQDNKSLNWDARGLQGHLPRYPVGSTPTDDRIWGSHGSTPTFEDLIDLDYYLTYILPMCYLFSRVAICEV